MRLMCGRLKKLIQYEAVLIELSARVNRSRHEKMDSLLTKIKDPELNNKTILRGSLRSLRQTGWSSETF